MCLYDMSSSRIGSTPLALKIAPPVQRGIPCYSQWHVFMISSTVNQQFEDMQNQFSGESDHYVCELLKLNDRS